MMTTDDERREVARRLRGIKDTREGCGHELCCDLWSAVSNIAYRCSGLCDECEVAVLDSLADLIEPSCDREALLALADELDERHRWCCGGDAVHAKACAERIREALVVEQ